MGCRRYLRTLGLFFHVCVCAHVCECVHMCMDGDTGMWKPAVNIKFLPCHLHLVQRRASLPVIPPPASRGVREYSMQRQRALWGFLAKKLVSPGSVKSFDLKNKLENGRSSARVTGGRHAHPALPWVPVHALMWQAL